jgi:hypothetical protein
MARQAFGMRDLAAGCLAVGRQAVRCLDNSRKTKFPDNRRTSESQACNLWFGRQTADDVMA